MEKNMKISGKKPWYVEYLLIVIGTGLMGFAITSAFDAAGLVTGGFSGVAIIVKAWTESFLEGGIPLWMTNFCLNVPVFLLGIKIRGFAFAKKAFIGDMCLTVWLAVLPGFSIAGDDLLLTAVYGGIFLGAGIGLVFLGRGTTGGTDMMAALIQRKLRHYSVAQVMQVLDGIIVIAGIFVFGIHASLYAIVAIYVTTKVTDALMEGMNYAKSAFIITAHPEQVADELMKELDRGASGIHIKGMYTGEERMMVFCVVGKKQIPQLKQIVGTIDPDAFVVVSDAREVLGEGFQTDFS